MSFAPTLTNVEWVSTNPNSCWALPVSRVGSEELRSNKRVRGHWNRSVAGRAFSRAYAANVNESGDREKRMEREPLTRALTANIVMRGL